MKAQEFIKILAENTRFNGPQYRGAPMPIMQNGLINEGNFEDALRAKFVDWSLDTNTLHINWVSQDWDDNTSTFFKEIRRWGNYWAQQHKLEETIYIDVSIKDKCNAGLDYESIEILPCN